MTARVKPEDRKDCPRGIVREDLPAPKPLRQKIGVLLVMKIYRWLEQRKDGGLNIRAVDIEKQFNVTPHQSSKLRRSYFQSRGVFYGNV